MNHAGFSLHTGVMAELHQRDKLARLCRYIRRPAVSEKRLALTASGQIRYELKTPYRNGTPHVIFEPLDFIAKRGKKADPGPPDTDWQDKSPAERHRAMTWMQRLKRVFNIDIEVCEHCGGQVKVIVSIDDPEVVEQIRCTGPA